MGRRQGFRRGDRSGPSDVVGGTREDEGEEKGTDFR